MARVSNLLSRGIFFTFAGMIESMAPFILIPIFTRKLSVYDYGLWSIFLSVTAFLCPLLGLKLDDYIRARFFKQDKRVIANYVVSTFILGLLLTTLTIALSYVYSAELAGLLKFPVEWLWAMAVGGWLFAMFYTVLTYHQFTGNNGYYVIIHLVQAFLTLGLTIVLILSDFGWTGAIWGKLTGLGFGAAMGLFLLLRDCKEEDITLHPLRQKYRALLMFGIIYLPNGMLLVIMALLNRVMLAHMVGVEASSLFAVASLFPMIMLIFITGFVYAWQTWCFKYFSTPAREDLPKVLLGALVFFIGLPLGSVVFYYICVWLGPVIIGAAFHPALALLPITILSMVVQGYFMFSHTLLLYFNKIGIISAVSVACLALNGLLNYQLISDNGAWGAATANCITFAVAFLVTFSIGIAMIRKHYSPKFT